MQNWYAIQTNPKCEFRAERSIRSAGFGVYLPRKRIERRHKRTKKWLLTTLCLIPRYLFVQMPKVDPDWFALRKCDGVHSVMGFQGNPLPIKRTFLHADKNTGELIYSDHPVERLIEMQDRLEFDDTREAKIRRREIGRNERETITMRFPVGTRVRAKNGPFKAFGGMVTNINARGEVEAMIELFGRMTPVEFPAADLEPDIDETDEHHYLLRKSA